MHLREGTVEISDECVAKVVANAFYDEITLKVAVFLRASKEI